MMRGIFGVLAMFLVQVSPASSFGGAPFVRPSGTAVSTPVSAKTELFSSSCRSDQHGRGGSALSAGGADGDAEKKEKPAAKKKSSNPGGMGGWDWGFKSTPKKAAAKAKPVSPAAAEAAEIDEIKRKAAAEVKAEQEEGSVGKAVKAAAAKTAEIEAGQAEAEEIAEVKRQAAAEVKAEQEKAKSEAAAAKADMIAARKRAEKMAATARGDVPKETVQAAKKTTKAEPAKAEATKAKPTKAVAAPKNPAAKKSSGTMGGWNWGLKPASKKTTAKPAAAPAKAKTDAAAAAATAEKEKEEAASAAKAEKAKAEAAAAATAEEEKAAAAAAATAKAETAKAEAAAAAAATAEEEKAAAAAAVTKAKAEATKAVAAPKKPAAKKSSGAMGGWSWGKPASKKTTAKPAAAPAKAKTDAPAAAAAATTTAEKEKEAVASAAKAEKAKAEAAAAAAATAEEEKTAAAAAAAKAETAKAEAAAAAAAKAETAKAEAAAAAAATATAEEEKAAAAAAATAEEKKAAAAAAAAVTSKAETAKAEAAAAKAEAAAVRAAQEKRARDIAAQARGDVPKPTGKKAVPKEGTTDAKTKETKKAAPKETTPDAKTKGAAKADPKTKEAKKVDPKTKEAKKADPKTKEAKKADPKKNDVKKKEVKKPAAKKAKAKSGVAAPSSLMLTKPETIVVVTGATGRVGSLAVRRLLELYPKVLVRAIVNDYSKGCRLLKEEKDKYGIKLEIMSAELGGMRSATKVVAGASAVLFCASGYAQNLSPIQRLANAVRLTLNPSSVADVEGVRDVALALKATKKLVSKADTAKRDKEGGAKDKEEDVEPQPLYPNAPRFVLLSSAAVTRPNWSSEDKALYPLAADVPIVKLNPLNILTVKAEGEKELREVGIPYTVVRPCGLNDDHPKGRPVFSVGDTAAGRICRDDVADVLVRCLGTPEATGKTFEVQSLPGFEKVAPSVKTNAKGGIDQALSILPTDEALEQDPNLIKDFRRFSYPVLSQLRPVPMTQRAKEE